MKKSTELLAPAGTLNNMRYALAYGADAVYAGMPRYSLRVRNNDFDLNHLRLGIAEAQRQGRRFYVAANILPHNRKVNTFVADMAPVIACGPDALIMSDPGLISLVREHWPAVPIHLSVQANTMNYAAVRFWQQLGIRRIILSRELSLDEIAEIRQRCPDMELEVFVHGALCIAYSGRCLLSGYFNHRDPNQGTCTNACRWNYKLHAGATDASGDIVQSQPANASCGDLPRHPAAEQVYLLEEENRPGEAMPVIEDEHGTYIMNSKDLRAIEHVARLLALGVDSLKIEGRTKSQYYVARTTQAYRQAIDDATAGKSLDHELLGALEGLANRGYTDGFYQRHHTAEHQNYLSGVSNNYKQQYVGDISAFDADSGTAVIAVKNRFARGDLLQLIRPTGNVAFTLEQLSDLDGNAIDVAPGSGHRVKLRLPAAASAEHCLLARYVDAPPAAAIVRQQQR